MTTVQLYLMAGLGLWLLGLQGLLLTRSMVRRIIAINVMAGGVFMIMVALAARAPGDPDPILQALVVTGLVVGVSGTAFAVRLYRAQRQSEEERAGE